MEVGLRRVRAHASATLLAVGERRPGEPDVTISIGIAEAGPTELPAELFARADGALYEAKRAGRNCIRATTASTGEAPGGASQLGLVA